MTIRLLKALVGSSALRCIDAETVRLTFCGASGELSRSVEVPLALYRRMMVDGLLSKARDGRVSVSAEGRGWLRRALSHGDAFTEQHRETVRTTASDGEGAASAVTIDLSESPLAWLASRRRADGCSWISATQLAAGERLRRDDTCGWLMARVTADWSDNPHRAGKWSGGRGGIEDLSDAALDARDRVHRALSDVGPELCGVLVDVCCELQGLEALERRHAWPARSAKLALSGLARHYGLEEGVTGPECGRMRHWGGQDYRPRIGVAGDGEAP